MRVSFNSINLIVLACILLLLTYPIYAKTLINVGVGYRVPYLFDNHTGLTYDLIKVMNAIQTEYQFEVVELPVKRKFESAQQGWVDILMWDNINWGWEQENMSASVPLVACKDLYVTQNELGKTQSYFSDLKDKHIVGVNGFHYQFADFETDIEKLRNKFDITLVRNEQDAITMMLKRRADVAIVNSVTISWFLKSRPSMTKDILVSKRFDTQFSRHFLVPKQSEKITAGTLNAILASADKRGLLNPVYAKYGVPKPSF